MAANRNDLTTRFLLGELSEEERREVEERILSDNEFFEQMLAAEDDLIDEYLRGNLSEEQRSQARALFESSGEQRQNVEFTKQLISSIKPRPVPKTSSLPPANMGQHTSRFVWAAAALLFVLLGSWTLFLVYRQRNLNAREAAAEQAASAARAALSAESARRDQLMNELESERKKKEQAEALVAQLQNKESPPFTVTLRPTHFERDSGSTLQTIKVGTPRIRFQLVLESEQKYERYSVSVTSFSGRPVRSFSLTANQVQQGMIVMTLMASALGDDDFKIEVRGTSGNGNSEHVADYAFRFSR